MVAEPAAAPQSAFRGRSVFTRRRVSTSAVVVLVLGLVVTALLSWVSYVQWDSTEQRLLTLQTQVAGTVLQTAVPSVQTPLASAAEAAATTSGDAVHFTSYMTNYVGSQRGKPFISASLWRLEPDGPHLVTTVGVQPALSGSGSYEAAFFRQTVGTPGLHVTHPLKAQAGPLRLGYAAAPDSASGDLVAYAEAMLPPHRRATVQPDSPFRNLRFALYLGSSAQPARLLETNVASLPLQGRTASTVINFGDTRLYLVAASSTNLSGTLTAWLWWLVAIFGVVVTLLAAAAVERLVRRRRSAERLTDEVEQLLGQQRSIAESLQRALLPRGLPELPGMQAAAQYLPGVEGVEIGGDWYDLMPLPDGRFFFVVGDVSGRGVEAGAVMASLRFAIRAYASDGLGPEAVLVRLTRLLDLDRDKHFATVLCGIGDIATREITIANAGHPPPVVVADGSAELVRTSVGPPIGVSRFGEYPATTVSVPPSATLIAYTDGLIERPGEDLADSLARLRDAAAQAAGSLDDLLAHLVRSFTADAPDDTALLGVRWVG